ncbi:UvrD-helicase domain-containing protein [Pseudenhygromyxa sp. WMMC2535]|uniref:UvrD-helicase domain-containing protein n=1 Tax=Pseudenhygromyxa sp. WMMC2535 TaxID=2712867 RepID=UPI001554D084|nr:UvrD-helicase domain-containing protein [Pseudenhygromyxa sp. WMMC2535]NVB38481.1 UvrD-helicase domain-containing protein [Pseudenhygromyxa sp. WMMC2535]
MTGAGAGRHGPIFDPTRSVVLVASAGTGKTWRLVRRYLRIIAGEGPDGGGSAWASPEEVVAVTFTRAAAAEMRARVFAALTCAPDEVGADDPILAEIVAARGLDARLSLAERVAAAPIGTIHSLCARLLAEFPERSGVPPDARPLEPAEQALELDAFVRGWLDRALDEPGHRAHPGCVSLLRAHPLGFVRQELRVMVDDPALPVADEPGPPRVAALAKARWRFVRAQWSEYIALMGPALVMLFQACVAVGQQGQPNEKQLELAGKLSRVMRHVGDNIDLATIHEDVEALMKTRPSKSLGPLEDLLQQVRNIHRVTSTRRERPVLPDPGPALAPGQAEHLGRWVDVAEIARQDWLERLRERAVLRYDDLERLARGLLADPQAREQLRGRYRHLLVDEYQDINPAQAEIIENLTDLCGRPGAPARVFFVGDPKQSIYRFRGADPGVFARAKVVVSRDGDEAPEDLEAGDVQAGDVEPDPAALDGDLGMDRADREAQGSVILSVVEGTAAPTGAGEVDRAVHGAVRGVDEADHEAPERVNLAVIEGSGVREGGSAGNSADDAAEDDEMGGSAIVELADNRRSSPSLARFFGHLFPPLFAGRLPWADTAAFGRPQALAQLRDVSDHAIVPWDHDIVALRTVDRLPGQAVDLLIRARRYDEDGRDEPERVAAHVRGLLAGATIAVDKPDQPEQPDQGSQLDQAAPGRSIDPLSSGEAALRARDIAILVPRWSLAEDYRAALEAVGISADLAGGRGLLSLPEVRDLINLIRLWVDERDELAAVAVLRGPCFGISDLGLYVLARWPGVDRRIREADPDLPEFADLDEVWESWDEDGQRDETDEGEESGRVNDGTEQSGSRGLRPWPRRMREVLRHGRLDPQRALDALTAAGVLGETPIQELRARLEADAAALEHGRDRLRALIRHAGARLSADLLADVIVALRLEAAWLAGPRGRRAVANAWRFVEHVRLLEPEGPDLQRLAQWLDSGVEPAPEGLISAQADAVTITTWHGAKGKEWPAVVLAGIGEFRGGGGRTSWSAGAVPTLDSEREEALPVPRIRQPHQGFAAPHDPLHEVCTNMLAPLEAAEAKRLLYVAMTRARDRLVLSGEADARTHVHYEDKPYLGLEWRADMKHLLGEPKPAYLCKRPMELLVAGLDLPASEDVLRPRASAWSLAHLRVIDDDMLAAGLAMPMPMPTPMPGAGSGADSSEAGERAAAGEPSAGAGEESSPSEGAGERAAAGEPRASEGAGERAAAGEPRASEGARGNSGAGEPSKDGAKRAGEASGGGPAPEQPARRASTKAKKPKRKARRELPSAQLGLFDMLAGPAEREREPEPEPEPERVEAADIEAVGINAAGINAAGINAAGINADVDAQPEAHAGAPAPTHDPLRWRAGPLNQFWRPSAGRSPWPVSSQRWDMPLPARRPALLEDEEPLRLGELFHAAMERWNFEGDPPGANGLDELARLHFPHHEAPARRRVVHWLGRCLGMVESAELLVELRAARERGELFHEVEVDALVPADAGDFDHRISGRVDLLWRGEDERWHVLDYKVTTKVRSRAQMEELQWEYGPQLLLYRKALAGWRPGGEAARLGRFGLWLATAGKAMWIV